jgi:uncharacterized protein (DUF1499 family)
VTAAGLSIAGIVVALLWARRHVLLPAFIGLALGLVVAGIPWQMKLTAQRVPPIHDISTDTDRPPVFVSVLPLRQDAPNPAEYGGPDIAAQQRAAYADLKPLLLTVPPDQAFGKALAAARDMGWDIIAVDPAEGRIEATDTTFWFGFKDDVVIRVAAVDHGSRIDVRSVSRVGKSDVGTNAKRIRSYMDRLSG